MPWTVNHPSSVVYTGLTAEYTPAGNAIHWNTPLARGRARLQSCIARNRQLDQRQNQHQPDSPATKLANTLTPTRAPCREGILVLWLDDEDAYGPTGVFTVAEVQTGRMNHLSLKIYGKL